MIGANIFPNVKAWFKRDRSENRLSVMVISDDMQYSQQTCSILVNNGYDVIAPANLLETLDILDQNELPELFICDFKDPRIDGKALIEKMRIRFGRRSLPPILFLLDAPDDDEGAIELGIDDLVPQAFEAS